jgi:hypothetical protein
MIEGRHGTRVASRCCWPDGRLSSKVRWPSFRSFVAPDPGCRCCRRQLLPRRRYLLLVCVVSSRLLAGLPLWYVSAESRIARGFDESGCARAGIRTGSARRHRHDRQQVSRRPSNISISQLVPTREAASGAASLAYPSILGMRAPIAHLSFTACTSVGERSLPDCAVSPFAAEARWPRGVPE